MNLVGLSFSNALFIAFSFISFVSCYLEYDGWVMIELHHSLDSANHEKFTVRGNVTISSLSTGLSNVVQERLSQDDARKIKALAEQDDFYRLRATVVYPNGVKQPFLTSIKACGLIRSQFADVLWISIDGSGFVNGITQTTSTTLSSSCSDIETYSPKATEFDTDVLIRQTELAPVPDTASFIQKMEREREAMERGEVRDNRGFFAKYWMYIVPVALLVLISGATNQETPK